MKLESNVPVNSLDSLLSKLIKGVDQSKSLKIYSLQPTTKNLNTNKMGPKKKSKASKLARMSEEERIRYMQHRAAIEEEARRRKEQLIATYMKNKFKHEEAFSRLNLAKINQQWRQILRKIKCTELKDDMKALWQTFDVAIIYKNKVIKNLLLDLEDGEIQYSMSFQSHMEIVNTLIGLHEERLNVLHKNYSAEKKTILNKVCREKAELIINNEDRCEHLQTIIYDMNSRNEKRQKAANSMTTSKQDELRNQMLSEIEKIEESGEASIEDMWEQIQHVLKDYIEETLPKRPHYNALRIKDKASSTELINHCETVNKYSDLILVLKDQLADIQCEHEVKLNQLKTEQSKLQEKFEKYRSVLKQGQTKDEAKLIQLTVTSNDAIKSLTTLIQKGRHILQIFSNCQKYLTEKEKLFIYKNWPPKQDETTTEIMPKHFKELDTFWHQYNEVLLDCESLTLQQESYTAENKQLKRILRHYLNTLVRPCSVPRAIA